MREDRSIPSSYILLAFYLVLLVWVVLFKLQFSLANIDPMRSVNLIPFYYGSETSGHLREVIDNVAIFVPFGVYMRMAFRKLPVGGAALIIALTSLSFEIAQYVLGIGASDVTDLISNTTGGAIGILAYSALTRVVKNGARLDKIISIISGGLMTAATGGVLFLILANQ